MVNTYDTSGEGRVKVFFVIIDGEVKSTIIGDNAVSFEQGFQLYVDDYVAEQIHKLELSFENLSPILTVKDGEVLFVPEENAEYIRLKEIEELENRLQELKGLEK